MPDDLEEEIALKIEEIEEEKKMPLTLAIERIAKEKGKYEGVKEGVERVAHKMIVKGIDSDTIKEVTGLSDKEIKKLETHIK